jgi:uncharacterized protein (DUF1778 family)
MPATAQLPIRIDPADKELLSRAAALAGVPVTQFVLQHAMQAAHKIIAETNTVKVANEAFDRFLERLQNPDPDNPGLKRLAEVRRKFAVDVK